MTRSAYRGSGLPQDQVPHTIENALRPRPGGRPRFLRVALTGLAAGVAAELATRAAPGISLSALAAVSSW